MEEKVDRLSADLRPRPRVSPDPARSVSLLAIFGGGISGARTSGCRPKPPFWNRRCNAVVWRWRWRWRRRRLLRWPPGVKACPAMCPHACVGVQAARCRRRCNLPDGYMHCYHAARLPGFSRRCSSPSHINVVQRKTTKPKVYVQAREAAARFFLKYIGRRRSND